MTQQAAMLEQIVQSNGAVLERVDKTLNTLTTAMTQQLSSLSRAQAQGSQVLPTPPHVLPILDTNRTTASAVVSAPRSMRSCEEVPSCLSLPSLFNLPSSQPGLPAGADISQIGTGFE